MKPLVVLGGPIHPDGMKQLEAEAQAVFHHQDVGDRQIASRAGAEASANRVDRIGDVGHFLHGAKLAQRADGLAAHGGVAITEELDQTGDDGGLTQSAGEPAGTGASGRRARS